MAAETSIRPGTLVGNRFEIESLAGIGGMGEVYRARDRETDETVAVKFVRHGAEVYGARFAREARALAQIAHPGIVRYIAHGSDPSTFLAMEWLEGEDLARRLSRGALAIPEVLAFARRIISALTAAHARGVVHRDIKPSNVFLAGGRIEEAKLLDFGVAQLAKSTHPLTGTGQLVGTLGYLAPEQALSGKDVTPVADVFSLGCVLFECLTGQGPFPGEGAEVLTKILLSEPARVRELRKDAPIALDELIMRMLRKAPETRASLASVAADVASLLASASRGGDASSESDAGPAVTGDERRLLSIVLASDAPVDGDPSRPAEATADTMPGSDPNLAYVVATHDVNMDRVAGGAQLITLGSATAATDLAARAARCALAVRSHMPAARVVVASGRGDPSGPLVAEVVARARGLLATQTSTERVRIDAMTAGLLDSTFEVEGRAPSLVLVGRRETRGVREILGKPTPCVGRERELSMLHGLVNECLSEPIAMALVVTANAGVGKSRLVHEVLRSVHDRAEAPEIWIARGDPSTASKPYGMLAQILAGMAHIDESDRAEVRRQKLLARIGRNLPIHDAMRIAPMLGEIVGAAFSADDRPQLHAARQDPSLMNDYVRHAWEDFVEAEVSSAPLVIVLEDLHWGDGESVRFVDSALRAQRSRPLLVLAVARPEVHEVFPALFRSRRMNELVLTDLTPSASRRLVLEVLGADTDPKAVDVLVERAGGNAFFLEELIRSAATTGTSALPETVLAMVQARIERLQPGARRVLRAASVLGARFWASAIAALIRADRIADVHATLDDLVQREVIVRSPDSRFPSEAEYVFRHALMRDAAYEMLTERDRKAAHLVAAEWLEAKGEREALVLAEHLDRSHERTRAIVWYLWAAEQALEADDLRAVRARVDRGIACGASGGVLGELLLLKAEASGWARDPAHRALAEEALAQLPKGSPAWSRAATEVAVAAGAAGDVARLRAMAEVLADAPRAAIMLGQAWGIARVLVALIDAGESAPAAPLAQALAAAASLADAEDAAMMRAMSDWASAAVSRDETTGDALGAAARALTTALEAHGPKRMIAVVERTVARQRR